MGVDSTAMLGDIGSGCHEGNVRIRLGLVPRVPTLTLDGPSLSCLANAGNREMAVLRAHPESITPRESCLASYNHRRDGVR